jgi:hypothetical protein
MTDQRSWALAFARQAAADLDAFFGYERHPEALVAECHKQLFLQMACEKLCKAYLLNSGASIETLQTSHGYIRKNLPLIVREELRFLRSEISQQRPVVHFAQQIAGEIELLAPAVRRGGTRPDNCEYPWSAGNRVHSPLDWNFVPSKLVSAPFGRTILKLIRTAIGRLL